MFGIRVSIVLLYSYYDGWFKSSFSQAFKLPLRRAMTGLELLKFKVESFAKNVPLIANARIPAVYSTMLSFYVVLHKVGNIFCCHCLRWTDCDAVHNRIFYSNEWRPNGLNILNIKRLFHVRFAKYYLCEVVASFVDIFNAIVVEYEARGGKRNRNLVCLYRVTRIKFSLRNIFNLNLR